MNIRLNTHYQQRGSVQQVLVLFVLALVIVAVIMAVFGYKIGHKQGVRSANQAAISEQEGEEQQAASAEISAMKKQLETAITERDIGLSNIDTLKQQNETIKTENLQLTQLNALLLENIAKEGGLPLKVLGSEIVPLPERTFEYRFDVAMVDKSGKAITMMPKLTLLNATSMVNIPLKPAAYEVQGITRIRGRFVMPDGFEPKQIKLELAAGTETAEQLYNWQVGRAVVMSDSDSDKGIDTRPVEN